jgi:hypothetical protein
MIFLKNYPAEIQADSCNKPEFAFLIMQKKVCSVEQTSHK